MHTHSHFQCEQSNSSFLCIHVCLYLYSEGSCQTSKIVYCVLCSHPNDNTRSNHKPRVNNSDTCLGWEGDNCFKEVTMHLTISMEPYNNPNRKVLLSRAQLQECISGILHSKITRRVYCQKIPIRNSLFLTTLS